MSTHPDHGHQHDHDTEGQVSETSFGGDAPELDADAVPSEHSTPGPDDADV